SQAVARKVPERPNARSGCEFRLDGIRRARPVGAIRKPFTKAHRCESDRMEPRDVESFGLPAGPRLARVGKHPARAPRQPRTMGCLIPPEIQAPAGRKLGQVEPVLEIEAAA